MRFQRLFVQRHWFIRSSFFFYISILYPIYILCPIFTLLTQFILGPVHTKTIVNANASKRKLFYAFRPSVHTKTMKTLTVNA